MSRAATLVGLLVLTGAGETALAQAVPEGAPASRVQLGYRRTPSFRNDPFRHVTIPHWGLVFSGGGTWANNAINVSDVGAVLFLSCPDFVTNPPLSFKCTGDSLGVGDGVDALGLIPRGSGLKLSGQGDAAVYLGGPFGSHFSLGLSARGTGYGAFQLDDNAIALLRDGNGARQDFSLGNTGGSGLATAEAGAHAILRFGPLGSADGVHLNLGFGGRHLRPIGYGSLRSTVANGGTIRVTGDSIKANIALEQRVTTNVDATLKGSGKAADFLLRLEWPTSGLAIEALVANIGSVTVPGVERSSARFNVSTTKLQEVSDSLDAADFTVQDTVPIKVTLPKVVRFTASSWANRILQIDLSATLPVSADPVTGGFEVPLVVDLQTTWRFLRTLPLRAGLVLGGNQGIGYTGGIAIEGRNMFFQLAGQSLGGLFKKATGVGGRLELGFFF
ncbi:MAG: hypothetical protein HY560_04265 [Gemmatimonadetes bacterium]|nr:hypothetical protein [Gemmatimonadota bacterium]